MGLFNNIERMIVGVEEAELMGGMGMGGMGMGGMGMGMGMGMGGMGLMGDVMLAEETWLMAGQMFDPYMHGQMYYDPYLNHYGTMYNGMWHPLDYQNGNWMFVHPSQFQVPRNYQPQNLQPAQQGSGYGQQGGYPQQQQGGYPQQQGPGYGQQQGYPQQQQQGYPQQQQQGYPQQQQQGYPQQQQGGYPQQQPPRQPQPAQQPTQQQQASQPAAPTSGTICSRCHASSPVGARFCSSCGNDIAAAPEATPPAAVKPAFCTSCGAAMAADMRFCSSCGKPRG